MLKAIETVYNGYRFRSRLEARWAVFFDALDIEYRYEPEGFDLGNGVYYLPDFWLPTGEVWIEVKGSEPIDEEISKATRLAQQGDHPVAIFWGDFTMVGQWDVFYCCKDEDGVFWSHTNKGVWEILTGTSSEWGKERLGAANIAARHARFEHDERQVTCQTIS